MIGKKLSRFIVQKERERFSAIINFKEKTSTMESMDLEAINSMRARIESDLDTLFGMVDANGDGFISE